MTETKKQSTKVLVLGGGGTTGIAWEMGLLLGLQEVGIDVADADLIIRTSAGSMVGAQITSGLNLEELYALQLRPLEETQEPVVPYGSSLLDLPIPTFDNHYIFAILHHLPYSLHNGIAS